MMIRAKCTIGTFMDAIWLVAMVIHKHNSTLQQNIVTIWAGLRLKLYLVGIRNLNNLVRVKNRNGSD